MDKRTLLAVVLSVVIISVGFMIQGIFFGPDDAGPVGQTTESVDSTEQTDSESSGDGQAADSETDSGSETILTESSSQSQKRTTVVPYLQPGEEEPAKKTIEIETDVMIVTLSTMGGDITSMKLKEHLDKDQLVDMIFDGGSADDAFFISFGGVDAEPVDATFHSKRGQHRVEFRRDFKALPGPNNETAIFTLIKAYEFSPDGYMFELKVTIENSIKEYPNLDFNGFAYTLGFGPQIGPEFETLGGRGEFRYYYTYEEGKRNTIKVPKDGVINRRFTWAGIAGKYFTILGVPDATPYMLTFASPVVDEIPTSSFMFFSRPLIKSSRNTDVYKFYMGPKTKNDMGRYNNANENIFSMSDLNLDAAIESGALLGWLEAILKFFLDIFYKVIPNYGVAIILLTIMIKVLFYPLTKKSFESTSKMQELNPKITEIKEKFKDNSQRMNQEMAALYKKEKVNPLGGCLPLLLQMPIFIGLYQVLSKHFALRGAPFIWWITDLSEPDSIWNFAPFKLPLLNWTDLRLLPILFIATQLLSSKLMQSPTASSTKNMKLMTYMMPIFFFFILYNAPSGLLLYWTLTNVLTSAQQKIVSVYKQSHDPSAPKKDPWLRKYLRKYFGK